MKSYERRNNGQPLHCQILRRVSGLKSLAYCTFTYSMLIFWIQIKLEYSISKPTAINCLIPYLAPSKIKKRLPLIQTLLQSYNIWYEKKKRTHEKVVTCTLTHLHKHTKLLAQTTDGTKPLTTCKEKHRRKQKARIFLLQTEMKTYFNFLISLSVPCPSSVSLLFSLFSLYLMPSHTFFP